MSENRELIQELKVQCDKLNRLMAQLQGNLIYPAKSLRFLIGLLVFTIPYTCLAIIFGLEYPLSFLAGSIAILLVLAIFLKITPAQYSIDIFDYQDIEFIKSDQFLSSCLERTLCDDGHSFQKEFRKNVKDYLTDIEKKLQKLETEEATSILRSI